MFENQIQIINCNNGWLVIIPFRRAADIIPGLGMSIEEYGKAIGKAAKIMHRDDVLERLKEENSYEANPTEQLSDPLPKTNTHFVFKTFPEVLEFLKNLISFNH